MATKWIQDAHLKRGAFTNQAKRAHMGVQEFAAHVMANKSKFSPTTVKRASLARTFKNMSKN